MKKILKSLAFLSVLFSLASCDLTSLTSQTTSVYVDPNPDTIVVRFIPSNAALADPVMLLKLKGIELMLEEQIPQYDFDVDVTTSYETLIEGMNSGQIHIGFLTSQQYAFMTVENPGKVEVLLTSVRNAYAAQIDNDGKEIKDVNTLIANINDDDYLGALNTEVKVGAYYSMLVVKTEDYLAGLDTLADLVGKKVGVGSVTSGSGYVYPAVLLHENGLKFVTDAADGVDEIQAVTIAGGHQSQLMAVLNGDVDAAFAFWDARVGTTAFDAYNAVEGQNAFHDLKVIGLSTGIYNDTISAVSTLTDDLKAKIQQAFIDIIATDAGKQALTVYNHTGYLVAHDEDYDGERAVYIFKRDNLS